MGEDSPSYWNRATGSFIDRGRQRCWRQYCDALHDALLREWLTGSRVTRVLKTDLFDEAVAEGLVPALAALASEVHGIDVSARVVGAACARYPAIHGLVGDVRALPYPDGHFELVVSNSTLDHFPRAADLETALRECCRVLVPGGRLLITLDNLANPIVALRNALPFGLLNRVGLLPYRVGATLTPAGLRGALEGAGFEVTRARVTMHVPRVLGVWLGHLVDRTASERATGRWVGAFLAFEALERWPSRKWTGHYAAALAVRPDHRTA